MSKVYHQFEQTLAWHCAPSLAGIKAADLVFLMPQNEDWPKMLGHYVQVLGKRGIRLRVLGRYRQRLFLMISRPEQLDSWLAQPQVSKMLADLGYPVKQGTEAMLAHLRQRIQGEEFPHEIGLFLGYPPEDVEGFLVNGGRNCKLVGPWKVYGNVEEAARRFDTFQRCRNSLSRRISQGQSLAQVFPAA